MRGFTLADVIARYKRMDGYNVLFPCGTHASGNQAVAFASKIARGDQAWIEHLRENGCPEDRIPELVDPLRVVSFLNEVFVRDYWRRFGFSMDYRRFTCTTYPDYAKFIQWQFCKLKELDLLSKKAYHGAACPSCGPVAVDPSETDISKGGSAEKIELILVPFLTAGGEILSAATLRPETIHGVTNLWVHPTGQYVKAQVCGEIWIMSPEGLEKLAAQQEGVTQIGIIDVKELIGQRCRVPFTDATVVILPSDVVDPGFGTGVVMSVPAHAPADWIALQEIVKRKDLHVDLRKLAERVCPVVVVGDRPLALQICQEMGISSLDQRSEIEEATSRLNRRELSKGRMNENAGHLKGLRVGDARAQATQALDEASRISRLYEFSEDVTCRCGERVIIRRIPDQWFIDYGNPQVKERAKRHATDMDILPRSFARNIVNIIDWFRERPCARRGRWLGTPLPFDPEWIVEPISDSTLYPAFYTINHVLKSGKVRPEHMTEEFFDYVFLGKGEIGKVSEATAIDVGVLARAREGFEYWYPVDLNIGGKEHQTVHFPAFLLNHVAILKEGKWPKGLLSNWYIEMGGGKVSKSKGGAVPIPDLAGRFTVDGMRLYYSNVASPFVDVEWDGKVALEYRSHVEKILQMVVDLLSIDLPPSRMDLWIRSRIQRRVKATRRYLERMDFRKASNEAFFGVASDLRWYQRRGGGEPKTIRRILDIWIRLMTPYTPHMAEEAWQLSENEGLVSDASFPVVERDESRSLEEEKEKYLARLMEDIRRATRARKVVPQRIVLYISEGGPFDEMEYLRSCRDFLGQVFSVHVEILSAHDPSVPDLGQKKGLSSRLRPAIWLG